MSALDNLTVADVERRQRWTDLKLSAQSCRDSVIAAARCVANSEPRHADAYRRALKEAVERLDKAEADISEFVRSWKP